MSSCCTAGVNSNTRNIRAPKMANKDLREKNLIIYKVIR